MNVDERVVMACLFIQAVAAIACVVIAIKMMIGDIRNHMGSKK